MPFNKIKNYSELLDLAYLSVHQRNECLQSIFQRDIENNSSFCFRSKCIRAPHKSSGRAMDDLFHHLTTKDDKNWDGTKTGSRSFEMARSQRLHWVKFHTEEKINEMVEVFSYLDRVDGRSVKRTYIYNVDKEYVVILEPQEKGLDYYLITAYYLNEPGGKKQIDNKRKKKLPDVY